MRQPSSAFAWAAAAALYFVLATLGHLQFSVWLVSQRSLSWQGQVHTYSLRDALPWLLPLAALALLGWLIWSATRQGTRQRTPVVAAYWLLWAGCVGAVDRWLTFSVPEYFHYPQYALLAWLLAHALDPERRHWPVGRLLALTTLLGALDEAAQYLWITTSYSHYFDFNDVLVNLLAAALGVMLYYGFRTPPPRAHMPARAGRNPPLSAVLPVMLVLAIGCAVATERLMLTPTEAVPPGGVAVSATGKHAVYLQRRPGLYDRWHPGAWRPRHWVLGPAAGLGALGLVWLLWLPFASTLGMDPGRKPAVQAAAWPPHGYDPAAPTTSANPTETTPS